MLLTRLGWCLIPMAWIACVSASVSTNDVETNIEVKGLRKPAEILVDHWGVSHIYASTSRDAFFVQGWNAARDRLWQIDTWRRSGLGELSSVFGQAFVEQDRAIRLFIYRGDMKKEWASYGSEAKGDARAFVAGINAYVAAVRDHTFPMPIEFRLAGYEPAFWNLDDLVRVRIHGVVDGVEGQVARAHMMCQKNGLAATELMMKVSPPWSLVIPQSLDTCEIPAGVLDQYRLALKPFRWDGSIDTPSATMSENSNQRGVAHNSNGQGSNNWVVAPTRTDTGRAILANDPHRALTIPSLRYITHLNAPDLNIIGAGEPALPGISIGHNDHVAFGLTIFSIAQEDLYVYDINPENDREYKYNGTWLQMRVNEDDIQVRGGQKVRVQLKFTKHGPVIYEDPAHHRAFAVRATWLETGGAPYLASIRFLRAKNMRQFEAALDYWGTPGENFVCADKKGEIGWFPAGLVPIRLNSDGLLPLPGDGRYEWAGYLRRGLLPSEVNPSRGYIATANQMDLPQGYPYQKRRIGFSWADDFRYRRIREVIDNFQTFSIQDSESLQNDYVSQPAQRLLAVLGEVNAQDSSQSDVVDWLRQWDSKVTAESAQAALFEIWCSRHLVSAVVQKVAPGLGIEAPGWDVPESIIGLLEYPDKRLGDNPLAARNDLVLRSLANAVEDTKRQLGSNRSAWRWGDLSKVLFEHPLGHLEPQLNVGPSAKSGDASVVSAAVYMGRESFRIEGGASFRMVLDVGKWDASKAINSPGQSGDETSTHYRDLFPMWLQGAYFPLLFSRGGVERSTEHSFLLAPAATHRTLKLR